jgi:Anaphase-promoting complex subunit 4 WD40 domain
VGRVRQIASGARGELFATGEFERQVQVWSLVDRRRLGDLDTVLDFGGERLALCAHGSDPIVIAGAWERDGICGYGLSGEQLWQRKDLRKVQRLSWAGNGELVTACFDEGPMRVLDASSGETVDEVRAVRRFARSPFGGTGEAHLSGHAALIDSTTWARRWKAPITGFAILSMALAPGALLVSDVVAETEERSRGPTSGLWCFDLRGQLIWRWDAPPETNCPSVAWDEIASEWVGVLHHVNRGAPDTLLRWSVDGEPVSGRPLGDFVEFELPVGGRHLITSEHVFETTKGEIVWGYATLPRGLQTMGEVQRVRSSTSVCRYGYLLA